MGVLDSRFRIGCSARRAPRSPRLAVLVRVGCDQVGTAHEARSCSPAGKPSRQVWTSGNERAHPSQMSVCVGRNTDRFGPAGGGNWFLHRRGSS